MNHKKLKTSLDIIDKSSKKLIVDVISGYIKKWEPHITTGAEELANENDGAQEAILFFNAVNAFVIEKFVIPEKNIDDIQFFYDILATKMHIKEVHELIVRFEHLEDSDRRQKIFTDLIDGTYKTVLKHAEFKEKNGYRQLMEKVEINEVIDENLDKTTDIRSRKNKLKV